MSYELVVRSRAKADIRRAAKWYEKQRKGLGVDFVAEVDTAIRRIEANPEQYQAIYKDIRHAITRRFPYGVFYRIRESRIVISAVVHLERSDVHWKGDSSKPVEPG
ncbi:MAG: type II toxin-antitoxin system RelE/ParE family toxin [Vicinamibacteria bacterium]